MEWTQMGLPAKDIACHIVLQHGSGVAADVHQSPFWPVTLTQHPPPCGPSQVLFVITTRGVDQPTAAGDGSSLTRLHGSAALAHEGAMMHRRLMQLDATTPLTLAPFDFESTRELMRVSTGRAMGCGG